MHDLLEEPLFTVRLPEGEVKCSLPGLLAELSTGRVQSYPRLREHQQDPFHVMTVQLAASVLARARRETAPTDAAFWKSGLLALAGGEASAWHLVEADPTKPAFLQAPCVTKEDFQKSFKPKALTSDELDTLDTAKNHDVKRSRASPEAIDLWAAALICSQTTSGYFGVGNYGIFRMNSGTGSRAIVTTVDDASPGPRFLEELPLALDARLKLCKSKYGYAEHGVVLTWIKPWNRLEPQHQLSGLEPMFIEAARAVRLVSHDGHIVAWGAGSRSRQIGGPENGDSGDPWTALNVADQVKALTVPNSGLTPKLLTSLLFEQDFQLTSLQNARVGTGATWFCVSVLVRGKTPTTAGFHSVKIPIPERARNTLTVGLGRDRLAALGRQLLLDCAIVENDCLKVALIAMIKGGIIRDEARRILKESAKRKDPAVDWARKSAAALQPRWRPAYFPALWEASDTPPDMVRARWARSLIEHARQILEQAERTVPVPSTRRLRAAVRARDVLEAALAKNGMTELTKEIR